MIPELIEFKRQHYPIYWREIPRCPLPGKDMEVLVRDDPEGPVYRACRHANGGWKFPQPLMKEPIVRAWALDPRETGAIPIQSSHRNPTGEENQIYAMDPSELTTCDLCGHQFGMDDVGYLVGPGHSPHDSNARHACIHCLDEDAFILLGGQILNSRLLRALSGRLERLSPPRISIVG